MTSMRDRQMATSRGERGAWRRWLALGPAALVLLFAADCSIDDGPQAIAVVQAQIPTSPAGGGCTIPGIKSELRLTQGTLDVALDRDYPYKLYPLIENKLVSFSSGAGKAPVEEQNNLIVSGFRVGIAPPAGAGPIPWDPACPGEYEYSRETLTLAPGSTAGATVQAIRGCNTKVLRQQFLDGAVGFDKNIDAEVVVRVTILAMARHGSKDIESAPFTFPVRVCYGCLQTGYTDPEFADLEFPAVAACGDLLANPYMGNPCNAGQDAVILCCAPDPGNPSSVECPGIPRGTGATTTPDSP